MSSLIGFVSGVYVSKGRGLPFVTRLPYWAIGIYVGVSPFTLAAPDICENPVLTARDVTDVAAEFVADPFMVRHGGTWYMFFEVMNAHTRQGDIGLATSSDGCTWTYRQIVLDEPFHLSYPYVFEWQGDYYMVPESTDAVAARLYQADDFPARWSFVRSLLSGYYTDPTVFEYGGRWWMFAQINPVKSDTLGLYYADELTGPWTAHPQNPIVASDPNIARPGGRVLILEGRVFRYAQDDHPTYGNQVRVFEIVHLDMTTYKEEELGSAPIVAATGFGWNADGMHHVDPHSIDGNVWIAAVDGFRRKVVFGLYY